VLAGDIGGTKVNLGIFVSQKNGVKLVREESFTSKNYPDLESILDEFLAGNRLKIASVCFGVAGPVVNGCSQTTNLPWIVRERELRRRLNLKTVSLVNDLKATAYGIAALPEESYAVLNKGRAQIHGTIGILAAGTGLGQATLVWDGRNYCALASEGGHADFAPTSVLELELCRYLLKKFGHVSYERVLSGPGLLTLHRFLRDTQGGKEPDWFVDRLATEDPNAVIAETGLDGSVDSCVKALDLFASIYGAEAGNVALHVLADGGIYLAGGIAPKILPKLKDGTFIKAFLHKGRLSDYLSRIPVRVVLEQKTALYGAASHGLSLISPKQY